MARKLLAMRYMLSCKMSEAVSLYTTEFCLVQVTSFAPSSKDYRCKLAARPKKRDWHRETPNVGLPYIFLKEECSCHGTNTSGSCLTVMCTIQHPEVYGSLWKEKGRRL